MVRIDKKRKRVVKRGFWKRFFFRYHLSMTNYNELKEVMNVKISRFTFIMIFLLIVGFSSFIAIFIFRLTPGQRRATYQDHVIRQSVVDAALRIDSLERVFTLQNKYITNIQDIFSGNVKVDTVYSIDSLTVVRSEQLLERSVLEEQFSRQFEESERYNITSQAETVGDVVSMNFFRPTSGIITVRFSPQNNHLGVDIAANPSESVVATLDGTVMLSAYTAQAGYVICIYHNKDVISVYKHCGSLLRKEGDKVRAGDVVALVGNGENSSSIGPHLHFELWHGGQPLDPEKYIIF